MGDKVCSKCLNVLRPRGTILVTEGADRRRPWAAVAVIEGVEYYGEGKTPVEAVEDLLAGQAAGSEAQAG